MYKIAICDDDKRYRKTIREIIEHENSLPENEIRFYEYESGNELLKHSNYCSYCSSWVQRAIIYNGEQVEKWIDNCREFEKALDRSEVFRSVL